MDKVLFIDDEKDILKGYKSIFSEDEKNDRFMELASDFLEENLEEETYFENLQLLTANQGLEGIELIKNHLKTKSPIKIVFIDMRMPPGIDGHETARRIRELDPKIEIVIATAYSDTNLKEIVEDLGSPDKLLYIKKPFDLQEVKQIVLNLIVKSKNESVKDDFISNISHEIKTPLASIVGFSHLISENEKLDPETKEFAAIINHSANLMNSLIEELLTAVEFKKSGVVLNNKKTEMVSLTEKIYKSLLPIFKNKGIEYVLDLNECQKSFFASMDPIRYAQVINNLVSNAEKFTKSGKVSLKLKSGEEYFSIIVKDTGIGMSNETKQKLFTKFSRGENVLNIVPGLGLGLSIVKEIVDTYNGIIEVHSDLDKGTEIRIFFPYVENI